LKPDRIIGIDPGLNITGVGIVEKDADERPHAVYSGTIRPPRHLPIEQRLLVLERGIKELIAEYRPVCLAIEEAFYHKNIKAAMTLGQARGAALLAAAESCLDVIELSPKTVKMAAVGTGGASKEQVGSMVVTLLRLSDTPDSPDACDALAVALAALNRINLPAGLVHD
jgi:crossover junction endodeoxyribonuclease RuvC